MNLSFYNIIFVFDFFFRGFVILATFMVIFSNLKTIKKNRVENSYRDTLKYYKTWLQHIPIYASYFTSVLVGLGIFRFGSLLLIKENKELELGIFNILIMDNNATLQNQFYIIAIGVVGCVSLIIFSIIKILSFVKLSTNFSDYIDIKEGNRLIKDGIYSKLRHPIYLSEIMIPLSISLVLQNWMILFWSVLIIAPLYYLRALKEDELLFHYYKGDFAEYKKNVSGFIPSFVNKRF